MTAAEMIALAERVEKAAGPDRDIDGAVASLFLPGVESDNGDWWWGNHDRVMLRVPAYTASLDAAASLADEWAIAAWGDLVADGLPGAMLLLSTDPVRHAIGIGHGTRESGCLARAMTAAALRARAAMMEATP